MDIGSILLIGGGVWSAGSNLLGGYYASKQGKYQRDIYNYQQKFDKAARAIQEERIKRELRKVIGAQRASTAAAGIQPDVGTPLELQIASEMEADMDIALLRIAGGMENLRLGVAGKMSRAEGMSGASSLYARGLGNLLDTAGAYGQRAGWFEKKQPKMESPYPGASYK